MPIKQAAMKALRQTKKATLRNKTVKENIKYLMKKTVKGIEKQEKEAGDTLKKYIKTIDKAVQKKILKKNTAARMKSRMMKKFNQMAKK